ncbi:hypothetical protein P8452_04254 [Trifolium repens]|nr:hypothetical protein P8452_04254 [Trifolium repens]
MASVSASLSRLYEYWDIISRVFSRTSKCDVLIAKMQSEIDVLTKEVVEVNELKAKVAEFDAMKEQFAVIMANMQNHGSNTGSLFEVRRSSESSHNVEGDQATPDD